MRDEQRDGGRNVSNVIKLKEPQRRGKFMQAGYITRGAGNCLDGPPVTSDCLSLAEGLGWRTAGSLLGIPRPCWGKIKKKKKKNKRSKDEATSKTRVGLS